jgi:hypothetical protein
MAVGKIPLLAKHPPLPVFQIATDINPFHPVITDKQGPMVLLFFRKDTLSLLLDDLSYKTHYPIQLSCCTLNQRVSLADCPNKLSFLHVMQSLFGSPLYLVPKLRNG